MTQKLALVLAVLNGFCFFAQADNQAFVSRFHSHNDYLQNSPLKSAVNLGLSSVEADSWYTNSDFMPLFEPSRSVSPIKWWVSHDGFEFNGTLENLYLKPLRKLVAANNGSVLGDGKTFYLWIEFKQPDSCLAEVLHSKLMEYASILYNGGPIQVVLTGEEAPKKEYVKTYSDLAVMRDSLKLVKAKEFSRGSSAQTTYGWGWYSVAWSKVSSWNGSKGAMPQDDQKALRDAVEKAHLQKRKIRFFHLPDNARVWQECLNAGVDLISVDDLSATKDFLKL